MAHAPTATRPHVAFGRVTTNNGAVCAWAARGTKKRGLRVVCALSGARLLRLRCQGNQGNQETTEITEINRNRQKSTEIDRNQQALLCFLCFLCCLTGLCLHWPCTALSGEWPAWFPFLVFWALAGACQRHGVGGFIAQFTIIILIGHPAVECKNPKEEEEEAKGSLVSRCH